MASLEAELSEVKLQTHIVEQENLLLKDELEQLKQVSMCFPSRVRNDMYSMVWCLQPPKALCTVVAQPAYCFKLRTKVQACLQGLQLLIL